MAKKKQMCCDCKFPLCGLVILLIAVAWLLSDLKILALNLPWAPIIVILAMFAVMKHHHMKK